MCDICLQTPCANGCPNQEEPEELCHCEYCGQEVYPGDKYFIVDDVPVCVDCVAQGQVAISDFMEPIPCSVCYISVGSEDEEDYYVVEKKIICHSCMDECEETAKFEEEME